MNAAGPDILSFVVLTSFHVVKSHSSGPPVVVVPFIVPEMYANCCFPSIKKTIVWFVLSSYVFNAAIAPPPKLKTFRLSIRPTLDHVLGEESKSAIRFPKPLKSEGDGEAAATVNMAHCWLGLSDSRGAQHVPA